LTKTREIKIRKTTDNKLVRSDEFVVNNRNEFSGLYLILMS